MKEKQVFVEKIAQMSGLRISVFWTMSVWDEGNGNIQGVNSAF